MPRVSCGMHACLPHLSAVTRGSHSLLMAICGVKTMIFANCVDIQAVRVRPPGGGAPFGIKPGAIYDFAAKRRLVPADWPGLLHETNLLAAAEAGRLGLPPPPPAVAPGVVGLGVAPPALVLVAGAGARAPAVGGGVPLPIVVGGLVGGPVGLAAALGGAGPAAGVFGRTSSPHRFLLRLESDIGLFVMLWSCWRQCPWLTVRFGGLPLLCGVVASY